MKDIKFYYCPYCHNLLWAIDDKELPVMCCGEEMEVLVPNTKDGDKEKHIPVIYEGEESYMVKVGSVAHPMTTDHHIVFIAMETDKGLYVKFLKEDKLPEAVFNKNGEKVLAFYEYCNIHGLYKKEMR